MSFLKASLIKFVKSVFPSAIAKEHAESEFEKYHIVQCRLFESDFDRMVKEIVQHYEAQGGNEDDQK